MAFCANTAELPGRANKARCIGPRPTADVARIICRSRPPILCRGGFSHWKSKGWAHRRNQASRASKRPVINWFPAGQAANARMHCQHSLCRERAAKRMGLPHLFSRHVFSFQVKGCISHFQRERRHSAKGAIRADDTITASETHRCEPLPAQLRPRRLRLSVGRKSLPPALKTTMRGFHRLQRRTISSSVLWRAKTVIRGQDQAGLRRKMGAEAGSCQISLFEIRKILSMKMARVSLSPGVTSRCSRCVKEQKPSR